MSDNKSKTHSSEPNQTSKERRKFLTGLNVGAASLAALAATGMAKGQERRAEIWVPTMHEQDDWMSENAEAKHRFVFDTTSEEGFNNALLYGGNFLLASRNGYGLEDKDSSVIIIARHISTYFAYNDDMWAKYGAAWKPGSEDAEPPTANPYSGRLASMADQGVMYGVCSMATQRLAAMGSRATGDEQQKVFDELVANRIRNAHMVPAGIVAVNRAQERGYAMVNV